MKPDVKQCVDMRLDFFEKYYTVPAEVQGEVDAFARQINELGEQAEDAMGFEAAFASSGLSEKLNAILVKCTPKPVELTEEQKAYSAQLAKEQREAEGGTAKMVRDDIADTIKVEAKEELIAQARKQMVKADVFDEYTKASNVVDDVQIVGGFLKKLFKKK